jgi:3-oxoacyl-[acyl-carrier protein] reductase
MLDEKIVVITGGSRGIGRAIAECFSAANAKVIIFGRNETSLKLAVEEISNKYSQASISSIICDISDSNSVKLAFKEVFNKYRRLDALISNAGIIDDAYIGMVTPKQVEQTFSINTFGVLYCAQYASRLIARSGGGSIINLGSIMGKNGNAGQAVYSASKAAVTGITKSLAKELAPQSIRVNSIVPGFIDTDLTRSLADDTYEERIRSIKLGRAGTPEEVANVALFLVSDLSTYVTGQEIGVDGGMLI